MKKTILWILTAVFCLSSCQYDDSDLRATIEEQGNRLAQLEKTCNQINTNISSMKKILHAVKNEDSITAVDPIRENGEIIGYTLTFEEKGPVTIYSGKDGKDGQDAPDSPITLKKDESDGSWYWSDGENWLLDEDGSRMPATPTDGTDGTDGITPELKIKDGNWYWRTNGEWEYLAPATGAAGKPGTDADGESSELGPQGEIGSTGPQGPQGETGESFFSRIEITEEAVTLHFKDKSIITIPRTYDRFGFEISEKNGIGIFPGGTVVLQFKMANAKQGATVKVLEPDGWIAVVEENELVSGTVTGTIAVTAPKTLTEEKLTVLAFDGEGVTLMTLIDFAEGTIQTTTEAIELKGFEEDLEIPYLTNLSGDCKIVIPEGTDWLSLPAATKAMTAKNVVLHCTANIGATGRSAIIGIQSADGKIKKTVGIQQGTLKDIMLPEPAANEIIYLSSDRKAIEPTSQSYLRNYTNEYSGDYGKLTMAQGDNDLSNLFYGKKQLVKVKFPEGLEKLHKFICNEATNLISVHIPESVIEIGERALYECPKLEEVELPSHLEILGGNWISSSPIRTITFPASLKKWDYPQLTDCKKIETIYCKAAVPPTPINASSNFFYGCKSQGVTIYVPTGSLQAYKDDICWQYFKYATFEEMNF